MSNMRNALLIFLIAVIGAGCSTFNRSFNICGTWVTELEHHAYDQPSSRQLIIFYENGHVEWYTWSSDYGCTLYSIHKYKIDSSEAPITIDRFGFDDLSRRNMVYLGILENDGNKSIRFDGVSASKYAAIDRPTVIKKNADIFYRNDSFVIGDRDKHIAKYKDLRKKWIKPSDITTNRMSYLTAKSKYESLQEKLKEEFEENSISSQTATYWTGEAGHEIIKMGKNALPFVMAEISSGNFFFNPAANSITGMYMSEYIRDRQSVKNAKYCHPSQPCFV